jgi:hypothetical protein
MNSFTKVVYIGDTDYLKGVYARIDYRDGRLSITGEGDGCAGHIVMHEWHIRTYKDGWDKSLEKEFRAVWDRWHLNDMRAGTKEQEEMIRVMIKAGALKENCTYDERCKALDTACMYEVEHNGQKYKYGHAWLFEDVPEDVLQFLLELPEGSKRIPKHLMS